MCGIAGIIRQKGGVTSHQLRAMTDVIQHRGPDGEGFWISDGGQVGFGHRRLAIIDLSEGGAQPMHYLNKRYTITFNGEIYNYLELKQELLKEGYSFVSDSDTEVLLALYHKKKEACLFDLNGMFSFSIWDDESKTLFCARDRFGEKPFYYYQEEADAIYFASEIKQFWAIGKKKEWSKPQLAAFISYNEVINNAEPENTFYDKVYALKAAHYFVIRPGQQIVQKRYWSIDARYQKSPLNERDATDLLLQKLKKSIELRLRSDVPVGSSLSGGLDSSLLVSLINRFYLAKDQQQHTFSARFKGFKGDEGPYIQLVSDKLHSHTRHDVFLEDDDFIQSIQNVAKFQDEPFQSASIFAQYFVMKLAHAEKVKVLIDGQGADEIFGGYEGLYLHYLKQLFYNQPAFFKKEQSAFNELHATKFGTIDFRKDESNKAFLKRHLKNLFGMKQPVPNDYFRNILRDYTSGNQLQQLLRYADRNSMAHSVEVRLPFLDHHLVEFIFSLPDHYKLKNGWPKYILRNVGIDYLPKEVVWRRDKIGFEPPQEKYQLTSFFAGHVKNGKSVASDLGIKPADNDWGYFMLSLMS